MEELLLKYLDHLEEIGHKGADFVADQAPETVRQFIKWEIVSNLSIAALLVVLGLIVIAVWHRLFKWFGDKKNCDDSDLIRTMISVFAAVILILPIGGTVCSCAAKGTKAYIAPNVFLIEKAAELAGVAK